jgi:beta-hydroxyacyl-ACP dehydratase FabZ
MDGKTLNIKEILSLLPHRYPFVLVDRVLDYEPEQWIKAIKNVTINEPFFQGHFPGEPIMPGVLQIEAMAQVGGLLALMSDKSSAKDKLAIFLTIDKAKFRKPVTPGDQLLFHVQVIKRVRGTIIQCHGEASVDGKVASEADLMFSIMDKQ